MDYRGDIAGTERRGYSKKGSPTARCTHEMGKFGGDEWIERRGKRAVAGRGLGDVSDDRDDATARSPTK